jgi:hypothetical protein
MAGVNYELFPIVRMTHPPAATLERDIELGVVLFPSWLLLLGVLPFDRHMLRLRSFTPGRGFDEDSWSWWQRRWQHRRTLEPVHTTDGSERCRVTDEVEFEPRLGAARLLRPIFFRVFVHRHARLRRRFGGEPER